MSNLNLCKSVKSVDKTAKPALVFEHGTATFKPNTNTGRLLKQLAKSEPIRPEDIPIGPERTDLAFLALILQTCARSHQRTCSELGNVKAALINTKHDDPAVTALIDRIIKTPLSTELSAAAQELFNAAVKG